MNVLKNWSNDWTTNHKKPIKVQWLEPSQGRQKGEPKERPKDEQAVGTKK